MLSGKPREQESQRGPHILRSHLPVLGRPTLDTHRIRPWDLPRPCLLPLMAKSCRGAQPLGKSHCWPVFRREVGIPYW